MQARFQAGVGLGGMHPVGGGHDDRIQILFLGQEVPVILINVDLVPVFFEVTAGVALAVLPDVTHGLEADARDAQAGFNQDPALLPGPDHGHVQIVRAAFRLLRKSEAASGKPAARHSHPQTRRGRGPEKVPAAQSWAFGVLAVVIHCPSSTSRLSQAASSAIVPPLSPVLNRFFTIRPPALHGWRNPKSGRSPTARIGGRQNSLSPLFQVFMSLSKVTSEGAKLMDLTYSADS